MNISAIKKVCMENKRAAIYTNPRTGETWISNGIAAYLADAEIDVQEGNILHLFDLAEEEEKKKPFVTQSVINDTKMWATCGASDIEELLQDLGDVLYGDEIFRALLSEKGLLFIAFKYLKPLKSDEYMEFYLREKDGHRLVAVYKGMFASALIVPIVGEWAETMQEKLIKITKAPIIPEKKEEKEKEENEAEQVGMFEEDA